MCLEQHFLRNEATAWTAQCARNAPFLGCRNDHELFPIKLTRQTHLLKVGVAEVIFLLRHVDAAVAAHAWAGQ